MKVRALLSFTAILSSILGGAAVYLALSVPNDLKADSLMKDARKKLDAGRRDDAREELGRIIQQFPRTDAAAAATIALVTLGEQERQQLDTQMKRLRDENATTAATLTALQESVDAMKNAPPKTIVVQAPAPAPKPAAKKKATTHRSRRRR
jgi:outer membrane protein assembly factor BamD (BamD/ComL family)